MNPDDEFGVTIDAADLSPVDPARVDIAYRAIVFGMDAGLDIRDTAARVVRLLDKTDPPDPPDLIDRAEAKADLRADQQRRAG